MISRRYHKRLNYMNRVKKILYRDIDINMRWRRRDDSKVRV